MPEALGTYSVAFDEERAEAIDNIVSFEEYRSKREGFINYTTDQMSTNLGERYNVLLSSYEYEIKDGQFWGKDMDEPAIDSFIRGRDHRKRHGNSVDFRREDAEIEGFKKIEAILTTPDTPIGTMMLSISPPGKEGSSYKKRFHDVHILCEDEKGRRYVESRRYSSGLSIEEYVEKISAFTTFELDKSDPAASFLANPVAIANTMTPDNLHYYLHREHEYTSEKVFDFIKSGVADLIKKYAESLIKAPKNKNLHRLLFNTILNKADDIHEQVSKYGFADLSRSSIVHAQIDEEIAKYGYREVRETMAGCGASSGYELEELIKSPYSVAEFGKKKWDYKDGDCVVCKKKDIKVGPCSICKNCEKKFDEE